MALPVDYFQPETFQQANPMTTGIGAAQQIYQQGIRNQYLAPMLAQQLQQAQLNNQILQPQAQYAPQMTQAELAYRQAQAPYVQAQTQGILKGQIPLDLAESAKDYAMLPLLGAQAGLTNTQTEMNQFKINNPALMLPGMSQNLGAYALLQQMRPDLFGQTKVAPQTSDQAAANNLSRGVTTSLPGMPSAGAMTSVNQPSNSPILPQNPYSQVSLPVTGQNPSVGGVPIGGIVPGQLPSVQQMAQLLLQGQVAPLQKDIAQTNYYQARAGLANFQALPKDTQNQVIAQGRALNMSPTETIGFVANGGDINKLTQSVEQRTGQTITPQYAPSQTALQKAQISTAATAALTDINPVITDAMAPYSRRVFGLSPKLFTQELTNDSPDQQAQALAARALSPEVSGLRLKAMSAQSGIEAIREVQENSMMTLKNYQGMVSPQVYKLTNQYLDNWVARMSDTYNKSLINNTGQVNVPASPNSSNGVQSLSQPSMTKIINGVQYHNVNGKWYA